MEIEDGESVPVFVEAEMLPACRVGRDELVNRVESFLKGGFAVFSDGPVSYESDSYLHQHLASLKIADISIGKKVSLPARLELTASQITTFDSLFPTDACRCGAIMASFIECSCVQAQQGRGW
jgi:hypothetical protein